VDRVRTGIKGLDDLVLDGGIPLYSVNIIAGPPGSGKTIFVQNLVFNGVSQGLRAVYLTTLSEPQFKMVRNLQEFAFFDGALLGERLIYQDFGSVFRREGPAGGLRFIDEILKKYSPDLLVIDSLKTVRDLFESEKDFRIFMFDLAALLSVWEVTSFLVGEYEEADLTRLSEFAVVDGIIYLYGQEEKRFQKRFLRILKMRGTDFQRGEHLFRITTRGVEVYPRTKPEGKELIYQLATGKKAFGIAGLDEMLRGGLPEGTIAIISGSTGTGKTLFALRFLLEGTFCGEKGMFVSFEEPEDQIISSAHSVGWDLSGALEKDLVDIYFLSPIELDVDYHGVELLERIRNGGIKRLVIDSISSFESSVSDFQKYHDYLWALAQTLKRHQVTAIFTVLNHELFSPLVVSQTYISSLADSIIFLRYAEHKNSLKKVLGVLKLRGGDHDKTLREYEITSLGIEVLGRIEKEGVLG